LAKDVKKEIENLTRYVDRWGHEGPMECKKAFETIQRRLTNLRIIIEKENQGGAKNGINKKRRKTTRRRL